MSATFIPKKNDRVEWSDEDGSVKTGTVSVVRAVPGRLDIVKVFVIVDGGKFKVSGSSMLFRPSSVALPVDQPSAMDKWGVKSYRCIGVDDTPIFTCKITLNGKNVGSAKNGGYGGPNEHWFDTVQIRDSFFSDLKLWWEQFGGRSVYSVDDLWLDWFVNHKKFGQTAQEYISEFNNSMAQFDKENAK